MIDEFEKRMPELQLTHVLHATAPKIATAPNTRRTGNSILDSVLEKQRRLNPQPSLNDLDNYLREPLEEIHVNPIEWWQRNATRFPVLAKYALNALIIPAISVPVERVCSAAGPGLRQKTTESEPVPSEHIPFNEELAPSHKKRRFIKRCKFAGRGYRLGLGARGRDYRCIAGHCAERQRLGLFITCIYILFFL